MDYRAFVGDPRWDPNWFPLFADGGGWFYVLDLTSPQPTPVRHFRVEESENPIEFDSLAAFFKTIAAAWDEEIIYVDAEGYLEMEVSIFNDLAARLNPHVDWWATR